MHTAVKMLCSHKGSRRTLKLEGSGQCHASHNQFQSECAVPVLASRLRFLAVFCHVSESLINLFS